MNQDTGGAHGAIENDAEVTALRKLCESQRACVRELAALVEIYRSRGGWVSTGIDDAYETACQELARYERALCVRRVELRKRLEVGHGA